METVEKQVLRPLLPSEVEPQELSPIKLATILVGYLKNLRQGGAKTKTRAEVRGGGRKPWRQKGTGRARVGSIRSPLWRGGGIIFGPTGKENWRVKLNRRERQAAFSALLFAKSKRGQLFLLSLPAPISRTKEALLLLGELLGRGKILLVLPSGRASPGKAFHNLDKVTIKDVASLSALDLAQNNLVVFEQGAWAMIKRRNSDE